MVDLNREEDKQALVGTIMLYAFLFITFIILAMLNACGDAKADFDPGGGVTVSMGEPDNGGPDNSAAEQQEEEYTPPVVEEYVPESQLTSDVDEAPAVQETKPTTKPPAKAQGKPVTEPQQKETPKETTKPVRKLNEKSLFGKDKTGSGKGGTSDKGGYKGSPDGKPDGSPDGTGGQGNMGDGTGSGPAIGPGIDGGIGGFKVKNYVKPQGGVQKSGVVSLRVCVDKNGNVKDVSKNPKFHNINRTYDPELVARAKAALRKFKFTNVTGAQSGCGYVNFTFKVN